MTDNGKGSPRASRTSARSIEVEGKSTEEAISEALEQLGIARAAAQVEVLDEGKSGFMGIGSKNARVRVSVGGEIAGADAPAGAAEAGGEAPAKRADDKVDENVEKILREVITNLVKPLDETATVGAVDIHDGRYSCDLVVSAENMAVVLGRRGRTLDAIQTLAAALATRIADSHIRMNLDCGGFRGKRREVLELMAHDAAREAVESGDEIHLESMSAHDRKIVHATLSTHDEIETFSEDSGDRRHIVVRVKGSGGAPGESRSRRGRSGGQGRSGGPGRSSGGGGRSGGRGGRSDGRREGGARSGGRSGSGGGGRGGRGGRGGFGGRGPAGGRGRDGAAGYSALDQERDGNRERDYAADTSIPDDIGNRITNDER